MTSPANSSTVTDSLPPEITQDPKASQYLKTNSEARQYFESFKSEIERNEKVRKAIKDAVAKSADPRVQAFHDFLTHWHLQWPVVKEGAFGEGGIGFAWNKDLQRFGGGVDATAVIEERYILQIILDFNVSKDYAVEFTNLRFSFEEVKEVRPQPEGGSDVSFNTNNGKWFGLKEWEQLKDGSWDFSKIGINIDSNAPVPHIREAFQ